MENPSALLKIVKLRELTNAIDNGKRLSESELKFVEEIGDDSNQIVEWAATCLKISAAVKSENYNHLPLSNDRLSLTACILRNRLKSGKITNGVEKPIKHILDHSRDVDRLEMILFVKSLLKHYKSIDGLYPLILDYIGSLSDLFEKNLSPDPTYVDRYTLNKYFRCIKLCLVKNLAINSFTESLLNNLIDSNIIVRFENRSRDFVDSNFLVNILELIVYLLICSSSDVAPDRLEKLKSTLIASDGIHFKPDLIYSGLIDDTQQVEFNLACLERFLSSETRTNICEFLFEYYLNPVRLFWKLSSSIGFDCEMAVEWLITTETKFLVYFLKFLKYLWADINKYKHSNLERMFSRANPSTPNQIGSSINKLAEFLANLHSKLSSFKRSFPYNCEPLLKLLAKILDQLK